MTISRKSLAGLLPLYMALVVSASPLNLKVRQDGGQAAPDGQPTDAVPTENSSSTNTVYPTEAAGAPAPTSTQPGSLASDWLYQGCFEDTMERLLKGFYIESNAMTRDKCFASCQSQNLPVAGLEDGNQCYCGHEIPPWNYAQFPYECNKQCAGAPGSNCGGSWRMDLFALANTPQAPPLATNTSGTVPQETGIDPNSHAALPNDTVGTNGNAVTAPLPTASDGSTSTGAVQSGLYTTQTGVEPTQTGLEVDPQQSSSVYTESGVVMTETQANPQETSQVADTGSVTLTTETIPEGTATQTLTANDAAATGDSTIQSADPIDNAATGGPTTVIDPAATGGLTDTTATTTTDTAAIGATTTASTTTDTAVTSTTDTAADSTTDTAATSTTDTAAVGPTTTASSTTDTAATSTTDTAATSTTDTGSGAPSTLDSAAAAAAASEPTQITQENAAAPLVTTIPGSTITSTSEVTSTGADNVVATQTTVVTMVQAPLVTTIGADPAATSTATSDLAATSTTSTDSATALTTSTDSATTGTTTADTTTAGQPAPTVVKRFVGEIESLISKLNQGADTTSTA